MMNIYPKISETIGQLDIHSFSEERKLILDQVCTYIRDSKGQDVALNFICTHNSRRSQFAHIWAQTLAKYYKHNNINCYSAGAERTAVYPQVIKTLRKQGFDISAQSAENNPVYQLKYSDELSPIEAYSKTIDDQDFENLKFAAIMTCAHAQESCPVIPNASVKIALNYEDPKRYDGTELEETKYVEKSLEIAREMKYIFASI